MNALTKLDFNSHADLFLNMYKPREVEGVKLGNKNTYEQYRRGLTRLMEFMLAHGIASVSDIKLPQLTTLQDDLLRTPYSPKTVQVYLGVIKEFFYFLQNKGVIKANDFVSFRIVTVDKRDQKTPTLTESQAYTVMSHIMALPDSPLILIDKIILLIMLNSGVREEEITLVKIKDIVYQGKNLVINIHGKGMRKRFVVLSPEVSVKLMSLRSKLENAIMAPLCDDDYLIQSMATNFKGKNVNPMHRISVSNRIRKVSDSVGIYFTVHGLRRTFATILYKRKVPIEAIQRILGHESSVTTQGYIDTEIDKEVGVLHATSLVG